MKLTIELDLASPDHRTAREAFLALEAITKALTAKIPGNALLQQVLERYPNDGALVLAESAYDPTYSADLSYVVTCPVNMRVEVSNEEFDTTSRAAGTAKDADVSLGFERVEMHHSSLAASDTILSSLKKISS